MVAGRRSEECDFCGAPYGSWVTSLGMALCSACERAGADQPAREPVLVGDVLAGLADALGPPGVMALPTPARTGLPALPAQKRRRTSREP
ncbi:hypothetical protein ACFUJU_05385 [Streptomyces sp. NPDC057235]|uniref:hypothetical protein n=1 Tax=Streptomyces sp. NPDC057235 TaxID=3346058 RepID=UPI003624C57A